MNDGRSRATSTRSAGRDLSRRDRDAGLHQAPPRQRHLYRWLAVITAALALTLLLGEPAAAQSVTLDLGDGGSLSATTIQLFVLLTVLSLVPGLAIMLTCFPFVVTVLAILRQGIGLQQSPPNMLIVSLALFLTWFVMEPVFTAAWEGGVAPFLDGAIEAPAALDAALAPFRSFMAGRMDAETYASLASLRPDVAVAAPTPESPLSVLVPSFLLSEVARAFQVGFLIFLPFLIIDLVVAAILMSMGMMMVPPAVVSLPFKLAFFVVADGWTLLSESLVRSYF
ncbi:flagellar type III secretion system pore protein FliP [Pseudoroseicyclus sp. H15]